CAWLSLVLSHVTLCQSKRSVSYGASIHDTAGVVGHGGWTPPSSSERSSHAYPVDVGHGAAHCLSVAAVAARMAEPGRARAFRAGDNPRPAQRRALEPRATGRPTGERRSGIDWRTSR